VHMLQTSSSAPCGGDVLAGLALLIRTQSRHAFEWILLSLRVLAAVRSSSLILATPMTKFACFSHLLTNEQESFLKSEARGQ
jgi:hypothetical protein